MWHNKKSVSTKLELAVDNNVSVLDVAAETKLEMKKWFFNHQV